MAGAPEALRSQWRLRQHQHGALLRQRFRGHSCATDISVDRRTAQTREGVTDPTRRLVSARPASVGALTFGAFPSYFAWSGRRGRPQDDENRPEEVSTPLEDSYSRESPFPRSKGAL